MFNFFRFYLNVKRLHLYIAIAPLLLVVET